VHIIQAVTHWVIDFIYRLGYVGLTLGMFGQAVGVPLPSEVMMSFGGYLAFARDLTLPLVIAAGTFGDTAGALAAYAIGYYGGRPFLVRFGRLFFVRQHEIDRADRFFESHGVKAVFVCKLLPGIRAFASFPAGVTRMPLVQFVLYTLAASIIWCTGFAFIGFTLGKHWDRVSHYLRPISIVLLALLVVAVIVWLVLHFAERARARARR
jgi:membrane protein DedA with SNARE-associated domain